MVKPEPSRRLDVPEAVRRLALSPFSELPPPPELEVVELDGAFIGIDRWPTAQIVTMRGDGPADVGATVEAVRAVARERGKEIVAWWVPPDRDRVVPALEAAGLVNEDTPGFEAIENALALVTPPAVSALTASRCGRPRRGRTSETGHVSSSRSSGCRT